MLKHFIQRIKLRNKIINSKLSEPTKVAVENIDNTHDVIIELIQKEVFKQELQDLFSSSHISQDRELVTLNPILENNIIKVVGRLKDVIDIPDNLNHQFKAKLIIRKDFSTCLLCKHHRLMAKPLLMGNLSKERIDVFKLPFTITVVNCFRPATIKQYKQTRTSNNNQKKRYGVLFTCLTKMAVHLELSIDMTTNSFFMTLRRPIARKGDKLCRR